jgi:hypothetical protein
MSTVLPVDAVCVHQTDINLVNESSSLKRMTRLFSRHVAASQAMKLLIDKRYETVEGGLIA